MKEKNKNPIQSIARDYFNYLGTHLPQQCASDEFYFLPRSEKAIEYLNVLDDLTPEKIFDHIQYVRNLLNKLPPDEMSYLEEEIDRSLLRQSMRSFIREFESIKVWQSDPTLYVKIPLFAADNLLSRGGIPRDQLKDDLLSLFIQIPSFLRLAIENIHLPSEIALKVSIDMTRDAIRFFRYDIPAHTVFETEGDNELSAKNKEMLDAWERFSKDLHELPFVDSYAIGEDGLKDIFDISMSYPRSPEEILERARYEYNKTYDKLCTLAGQLDGKKTWEEVIYEQSRITSSPEEILQKYREEVQELRLFFHSKDIISFPQGEEVRVLPTPSYLLSLRATASYKAPMTGEAENHGIFFITPGQEALGLIATHSPYLAAHETYPGHHILDHIRIHHFNPIRRQIESPLFYEGWACYAELLLDELGYVHNPFLRIIGLQRQLWRNLRAELDIGLQTGKINRIQAIKKIEALGFPPKRAQRQVRRFCLTPGYQSCYSMGMQEILKLRKRYASQLAKRTFHDILLGGGQLPFHLVERRLEKEKQDDNG
ncbi:DUF885 family protein [Thermodesulfobacteriota bacterium]